MATQNFSDVLCSYGEGRGFVLPMTGFAYGSLQKLAGYAKPAFGTVLVGSLALTGADKLLESALLEIIPDSLLIFTTGF
jgi:hypothetical protein